MRYNWDEMRARAGEFASVWRGKQYEKEQVQIFYRDFFDIFGVSVRRVLTFEAPVQKLDGKYGFIDLFWKGVLLVEQKSKGGNLTKAKEQAFDYFPHIKESELPRFVLTCDFQSFELYDLDEGEEWKFTLDELPRNVEKLAFIAGMELRPFREQDTVNIYASELVGKIHDDLKRNGYTSPDLEKILVRIVFCMFADDTGLFEFRDKFLELLETKTQDSGEDAGRILVHLFQIMNEPVEKRLKNLGADLKDFPYVDGGLFFDPVRIPSFDADMRESLLEACRFDWSAISPAIFGSLFQFVLDGEERRKQGAHYTTEKNILKVLEPLFLTELREEFERLKAQKGTQRRRKLQEFHKRLAKMTFFDPACGCGNFLIIAYREMRVLEIDVIREIRAYRSGTDQQELDTSLLSLLDVDQFYGIELNEFAVRIAETALWMMDHIMNNRLSLEFGHSYARIPITKSPKIIHGDALDIDWEVVLPANECTYIIGNPPFIGSKNQSPEQRRQVRRIADLGGGGGTLDYVAAWFLKAVSYLKTGGAAIGFVATNSITQGEQVAQLWPVLMDRYGFEIIFAHQTFAWESEARGKAHVDVVIIGLAKSGTVSKEKKLFSYSDTKGEPHLSTHSVISPNLFDASDSTDPNIVVKESVHPLNGLPQMKIGTQPIDNNFYIFSDEDKEKFLRSEPNAKPFFHPFIGSREFLQGSQRWILSIQNAAPEKINQLPHVQKRIAAVREYRQKSSRKATLALASFPTHFNISTIPQKPYLVFPRVSSERREFLPLGWLQPPQIPSDAVLILEDADMFHFGLLTSIMHMSWLRRIGGRLTSSYRYSIGMVYNTFPVPEVSKNIRQKIEVKAQAVLDVRKLHPNTTLSQLYDPNTMPPNLRKAHVMLDREVNKLYRRKPFKSESERVDFLLLEYKKMVSANQ